MKVVVVKQAVAVGCDGPYTAASVDTVRRLPAEWITRRLYAEAYLQGYAPSVPAEPNERFQDPTTRPGQSQ